MKILFLLFTVVFIISCGGVSKKQTNYDNHKLQQQRADAAFNELDVEAEKENPEDLVLDEKPLEIKPKENSNVKPKVLKDTPIKKRPSSLENKKRPVSISSKERPLSKTKYPMKNGYPIWFYNPDYDGYLGAVGIAKKQGSFYQQQRVAKISAEAELAKKIKVVVNTELKLTQTKIEAGVMNYYRSRLETFSKHQGRWMPK